MNKSKPNTFYKTKDWLWMYSGNKEVTLAKQGSKYVLSKFISNEKTSVEQYDVMAVAKNHAINFISH